MYTLRDIQIEPVRKGIEFFKSENRIPSIIVEPTAFGKSLVIASIANEIGDKFLVLQPSKELLKQNLEKLRSLGGNASIYSASMNEKDYGNITYATIGSIYKIGHEFRKRGYKYLIVDEADIYSKSNDGMLRSFVESSKIKCVLGLTATPLKLQTISTFGNFGSYSMLRMLNKRTKHGMFFKEIIHIDQIQEMVSKGYWSKLSYEIYTPDTTFLEYNSTGAEYTDVSMKVFYEQNSIERQVLEWIEKSDRKKILIFAPSVNDAIKMSTFIQDSVVIYGNMGKNERDMSISNFIEGRKRVAINVNVLSVGFDDPEIDCIICTRPTASLRWWYQAIGRGTRIHPEKKDCLIVDLSGNFNKFGKIEDLYYKKIDEEWYLFGTGKRQLTEIDIMLISPNITEYTLTNDIKREKRLVEEEAKKQIPIIITFGKYKGKYIHEINDDSYLRWMLKDFKWTSKNLKLKNAIENVLNII